MSVLIRSMEMPKGCGLCRFDDYGFCTITAQYTGGSATHGVASFCPLVGLPEHHGRLFDADEVKKCINEVADSDDKAMAIALLEWAIDKRWCIEAEGTEE